MRSPIHFLTTTLDMTAHTSFQRPPFLVAVFGVVVTWLTGRRVWALTMAVLVGACGGGGGGAGPRFQSIQVNGKSGILDTSTQLVWASSLSTTPPDSNSRLPTAGELLTLIQTTSATEQQGTFAFAFAATAAQPLFKLVHPATSAGDPWAVDVGSSSTYPPGTLLPVAEDVANPLSRWYLLFYTASTPPTYSFTASTDTFTSGGLMWRRCVEAPSVSPCSGSANPYTYDEAAAKIAAVNASGAYNGYRNWRLPTLLELQTLLSLGSTQPYLATAFASANPDVDWNRAIWTSTSSGTTTRWSIDFGRGQISPDNSSNTPLSLLLVRNQ